MNGLLFSTRNKIIAAGIFIAMLLALVLTIIVLQQQQNIRQEASTQPDILVTVAGNPITRQDVNVYSDTMYQTVPTDIASLQVMLNELIEKRLIESIAQREGITATDSEIQSQIQRDGFTDFINDPVVSATAKESVIKRKLELKYTKTREAFTVGFWIPPLDYGVPIPEDQIELVAQQRLNAQDALLEIEELLESGEDPYDTALIVSQNFPSLAPIMAVNGYIVSEQTNTKPMTEPVIYSYQAGRSNLTFFRTLFSLEPGQIGVAEDPQTNAGGSVIHVISKTDGPFDNYSGWFGEVKNKEVVVINRL